MFPVHLRKARIGEHLRSRGNLPGTHVPHTAQLRLVDTFSPSILRNSLAGTLSGKT
ncbi:MAG: hypothetical protein WDM78_23565 [Puia sp.]